MKANSGGIGLEQVQNVYGGPEGDLWELVMGQQIHIGGLKSSMDLADRADIRPGTCGVDLCCCNGAGMRFLLRFRQVAKMHGVDATETVIHRGKQRCQQEGLTDRLSFTLADVCDTGLKNDAFDFVWGEDAWCYVVDKSALIREAARLVMPGGAIAFTDWIEGPAELTDEEAQRLMTFMKFPGIESIDGYSSMLEANGCEVVHAVDTGRFPAHVDLYLDMLDMQLTYDALSIINFDSDLMQMLAGEMVFLQQLAHTGKIAQGLFVAQKAR